MPARSESDLLAGLPPVSEETLHRRRTNVLLILSGVFLGAMAMLNILGITKFVYLGTKDVHLQLAVGVLPYPLTFLCTDFISELYGRRRANFVVFVGLLVNLLVLGFVTLGAALPAIDFRSPDQRVFTPQLETISGETEDGVPVELNNHPAEPAQLTPYKDSEGREVRDPESGLPYLTVSGGGPVILREEGVFDRIARLTRAAILASMIAYLAAQFIDVYMFHFWKRLTRGKHLWLRNNGSTLVSQLVDTTAVVLITFWSELGSRGITSILTLIGSNYLFKVLVALVDTIPFYLGSKRLARYLRVDPARV